MLKLLRMTTQQDKDLLTYEHDCSPWWGDFFLDGVCHPRSL